MKRRSPMTFILTRIDTGDYDAFKALFDKDGPGARGVATEHRLYRNVDNPNEVFIQVEFESRDDAVAARERLLAAGVLDRFTDYNGPTVAELAESVRH
jgi:hypothetical protein